jgi:sialate O-acetylesterase
VPVWGWALPGEKVSVDFDGIVGSTQADETGRWQVRLDLSRHNDVPAILRVKGENSLELRDVVVGEVWLCSGQSNMEWQLGNTEGAAGEIAESAKTRVRQFYVEKRSALEPREDCVGRWELASPETASRFSAVGFYFGRAVQRRTGGVVGVLHSSWAGTEIERWLSAEGFDRDPKLKGAKDYRLGYARSFASSFTSYLDKYHTWLREQGRGEYRSSPALLQPAFLTGGDWRPVQLPGSLVAAGLPDAGIVWLRRSVAIPHGLAGTWGLSMELGRVNDAVTAYWNGEKIGETSPETPGASGIVRFWIPGGKVIGETAVILLRLSSLAGGAGFFAEKDGFRAEGIDLAGAWQARVEQEYPALSDNARAAFPRQPKLPEGGLDAAPAALFNAMINPLVPYAIKGVVWYQGESNSYRAVQYRSSLRLLIEDWRQRWGRAAMPFLICQIANYEGKTEEPGDDIRAELREAQASALSLPGTAMAVLIDLGEQGDIHPRNKKEVGERLALLARSKAYGDELVSEGPSYRGMTVEKNRLRLRFWSKDGVLCAKPLPSSYRIKSTQPDMLPLARHNPDGPVEGFAICGADRHWRWASAQIEGDTVVVWSDAISAPVAVRYAWASNPTCNLSNGAGLPAAPFRTDDFPLITEDAKY